MSEPTEDNPVAVLAVPMMAADGSVGVIELERAERAFLEREERVAAALGNHVALALKNLQLAENAREVAAPRAEACPRSCSPHWSPAHLPPRS